jgi:acyl-CoA thioesterase-1
MLPKVILFFSLIFFLAGLDETYAESRDQRVLVMGDSLLAWNGANGNSVADALDAFPGMTVKDRSVPAARYFHALPISGSMGMRLSAQFRPGKWDWVVLNGGGNDLLFGCGCGNCHRMLDRLVSKDGRSGAIPSFVATIRNSGARVLYVGYLRSPGLPSPIRSCRPAGDELDRRLAKMAKTRDGVTFLPMADLVPTGDRSFHAIDMIHPSVKGSRTIAARILERISN